LPWQPEMLPTTDLPRRDSLEGLFRTSKTSCARKSRWRARRRSRKSATLAVGGVLLVLSLAQGLADLVNWPAWASYVLVGGVLAIIGFILLSLAQKRLTHIHPVPEKTVETVKENVEWLKQKALGS
jgi:protein-S-isoprenylcysteine O-methyltransferase Ste14